MQRFEDFGNTIETDMGIEGGHGDDDTNEVKSESENDYETETEMYGFDKTINKLPTMSMTAVKLKSSSVTDRRNSFEM